MIEETVSVVGAIISKRENSELAPAAFVSCRPVRLLGAERAPGVRSIVVHINLYAIQIPTCAAS